MLFSYTRNVMLWRNSSTLVSCNLSLRWCYWAKTFGRKWSGGEYLSRVEQVQTDTKVTLALTIPKGGDCCWPPKKQNIGQYWLKIVIKSYFSKEIMAILLMVLEKIYSCCWYHHLTVGSVVIVSHPVQRSEKWLVRGWVKYVTVLA